VSKVTRMDEMFTGAQLSTDNYDATLIGWATGVGALQYGVTFDGGTSKYCNGETARNILTSAPNNWTITDSGIDFDCASLGTEDFDKSSVSLYPNPALSVLNIKTNENLANQTYAITDALGKIIVKGKLKEGDTNINVEPLSKGIYFIKIANNKASKFIKE
jgi:hypothetical protein